MSVRKTLSFTFCSLLAACGVDGTEGLTLQETASAPTTEVKSDSEIQLPVIEDTPVIQVIVVAEPEPEPEPVYQWEFGVMHPGGAYTQILREPLERLHQPVGAGPWFCERDDDCADSAPFCVQEDNLPLLGDKGICSQCRPGDNNDEGMVCGQWGNANILVPPEISDEGWIRLQEVRGTNPDMPPVNRTCILPGIPMYLFQNADSGEVDPQDRHPCMQAFRE